MYNLANALTLTRILIVPLIFFAGCGAKLGQKHSPAMNFHKLFSHLQVPSSPCKSPKQLTSKKKFVQWEIYHDVESVHV